MAIKKEKEENNNKKLSLFISKLSASRRDEAREMTEIATRRQAKAKWKSGK